MDDFSLNESLPKPNSSNDDREESGWTYYLEDISNHYSCKEQDSSCSSFVASPSLISDAATGTARKANHQATSSVDFPKKSSFGNLRTKEICEDDSLEDTASSIVNSPKVSDVEQIQMNPSKIDDHIAGNELILNQSHDGDIGNRSTLNGKNDLSRGLCLVPLSLLVKFNGHTKD